MESKRFEKGTCQEDLDLYMKGELVLVEGDKDDVSVPSRASLDKKVTIQFNCVSSYLNNFVNV